MMQILWVHCSVFFMKSLRMQINGRNVADFVVQFMG